MIIETKYICEICSQKYDSEEMAIACESKGYFNGDKFPAGLMFEYTNNRYVGIFSIPENIKPDTTIGYNRNHIGQSYYWACRTKEFAGDSLGEEKCGGNFFHSDKDWIENWIRYHHIENNLDSPEFTRMVKFLKGQKIKPSYYNKKGELINI